MALDTCADSIPCFPYVPIARTLARGLVSIPEYCNTSHLPWNLQWLPSSHQRPQHRFPPAPVSFPIQLILNCLQMGRDLKAMKPRLSI